MSKIEWPATSERSESNRGGVFSKRGSPSACRNPKVHLTTSEQTPNKNIAKLLQHQTSQEVTDSRIEQEQTVSRHNHNTSLHKKCAIGVHFEISDSDLKLVIKAWPDLPEYIRRVIKELVKGRQ
jgi:hypothetical protein